MVEDPDWGWLHAGALFNPRGKTTGA